MIGVIRYRISGDLRSVLRRAEEGGYTPTLDVIKGKSRMLREIFPPVSPFKVEAFATVWAAADHLRAHSDVTEDWYDRIIDKVLAGMRGN